MVVICAIAGRFAAGPLNAIIGRGFRLFNLGFNQATNAYTRVVGMTLRVSVLVLVVYGGLLGLTYWGFVQSPSGFIPMQDKGYLLVNVQLPDAASLERTERVMRRIEEIALRDRDALGVGHTVSIAGQSILLGANAPNFGAMFVMLKDFHERHRQRAFGRRDRPPTPAAIPNRGSGGHRTHLRRPAGRRPGDRRRVQDHPRGPRRQRPDAPCSRRRRKSSPAGGPSTA